MTRQEIIRKYQRFDSFFERELDYVKSAHDDAEFKESEHYRAKNGQFARKGGGSNPIGLKNKQKNKNFKIQKASTTKPLTESEFKAHKKTEYKKSDFKSVKKTENFSKLIADVRSTIAPQDAWRVDAHTPEEYTGSNMFATQLGSTIAVEPNGNIISVCRNRNDLVSAKNLLKHAVEMGGDRLDAFGNTLFKFYTKNGFEPVSACEFNPEYAPNGWDANRDEEEPILFYKYVGIGNVKATDYQQTLDEFKKNNVFFDKDGYDDAGNYRNKVMED